MEEGVRGEGIPLGPSHKSTHVMYCPKKNKIILTKTTPLPGVTEKFKWLHNMFSSKCIKMFLKINCNTDCFAFVFLHHHPQQL